jgi:nitroimidazol reductase NimA-like FMN-containing flavoprotein (pyridoxamine 5'-phosphate oxidase superfamily)
MSPDLSELARTVIDSNRYMALGTADASGHPWVTPVWFASEDCQLFYWLSSPEARHSRNLEARPEVAIAIFDSTVTPGSAQAVYMSGSAEELTGSQLELGIEAFDRESRKELGREWGLDDVQEPSLFRLYRATVSEHFVLIGGRDPERGTGVDRREQVQLD